VERARVRVELDVDPIARLHRADLVLLEVRDHVGLGRDEHQQGLPGRHRLARVRAELGYGATRRRGHARIRAIELRAGERDIADLEPRLRELRRRAGRRDVLIDGRGLRDVTLCLGDARLRETAARNRDDVKNTLHWRRRKGTLSGLEGLARDVGGFGVHAVEMFERVAWMQNLVHLKPAAVFALDLRRGDAVAASATPFSQARALADLRPADHRAGWHKVSQVAAFEWPIDSFPLAGVTPRAVGGGRYTFHPLGLAAPLYAAGVTEALREEVAARPGAADGDDAGRKAASRSFEIFLEAGLLGRAAFLPKGEDPDSFIRSQGKAALEAVLEQAVPLADYYFSWLEQRYGKSLEGKSQIAAEVSRILAKVTNAFEADLLARRAVDILGIREEVLRRAKATPTRAAPGRAQVAAPVAGALSREDIAERSLVSLMLRLPAALEGIARKPEIREWFGPKWGRVVDDVTAQWQKRKTIDVSQLLESLPPELASEIAALSLEREELTDAECARMAEDCLSHLRRKHVEGMKRDLRLAIRAAEEQKDEKAKRERTLEWQDLVLKERQLERRRLDPKHPVR